MKAMKTLLVSHSGDEFIIDGTSIHDSWRSTWPQVISRAWKIEYKMDEWKKEHKEGIFDYSYLAKLIKNTLDKTTIKLLIGIIKADSELKIQRKKKFLKIVKDSNLLMNDKLIKLLSDLDAIELLNWFYEKILKTDPVLVNFANIDPIDFDWYKKLLCFKSEMVLSALMQEGFIIDAMENPPVNFERNVSTRLIVRKPNQSYQITGKRLPYEEYEQVFSQTDRVAVTFGINAAHDKRTKIIGSRKNGWKNGDGLGHVLVLTLPPRPKDAELFGLAITDYEASGRVYSFTFT